MVEFNYIIFFLAAVNLLGFLLAGLNALLRRKTGFNIEAVLMAAAFFGGSFGVLLSVILFDRKAEKSNMMSRVFIVCICAIHIILLLMFCFLPEKDLNLDIIGFFAGNSIILIYLAVINAVTFILYGIDKYKAVKQRDRISIVTLLLFAFFGGAVGGLLAMYLFRHKTKKNYFAVGLPMMTAIHILLVIFIMNL